ncbi:hypothetical protein O6H91_04G059300 [Diphasiastrum complanatum]|uniref:Uncharacterized protein n=1 Tax=Diphasiastrum complanatum TaxID=34168 RepID=A0ACC2DXE7_DIPCM|nr:hypothetical protein O6H91_04G059300 [Diphasiastrum complanatum]
MPPTVGSSHARTERSFSAEQDTQRTHHESHENGIPSNKQRWRWRGLMWRVKLGVLPPVTAPIEELRRATADGRRRYAEFRRRLLVDPHLMEEGQAPPHDLSLDNPLSLNPDSVWGRFFRNVELERTIDKDLARLYPEHGSYFQGQSCQSMLRRVLLVWSLIHPQCSYRQGMHELLAPFLYVLHVDLERLSHMKGRYEDHFDDGFTRTSLQSFSTDLVEKTIAAGNIYGIDSSSLGAESKLSKTVSEHILQQDIADFFNDVDEFDTDVATVLMGSDMYGAEGELGSLLSARFIEHDAYCMFDALMSGQGGAVAMADYFISSSGAGSPLAVPPVIEASAALYRTLAAADVSLYAHFVELGVEPQFFALRWLRLLFGREFLLEDLLLVWDAIFGASNQVFPMEPGNEHFYGLKHSSRSALIYALAVSMLLYLRPALLAAPDATGCLQKLLNFPQVSDVRSLIENAKLLQPLAEAAAKTPPPPIPRSARLSELSKAGKHTRSGSISPPTSHGHVGVLKSSGLQHQKSSPCSPEILRLALPERYWEERWKSSMLQRALVDESLGKQSEASGTKVGSQQQAARDSDSVSRKEEDATVAADPNSCKNAQDDQQKVNLVHTIRHKEGANVNVDADMVLASNGIPDKGSDVNGSPSSIHMPEEGHCETLGVYESKILSPTAEGGRERMNAVDDDKDDVLANGTDDEVQIMNIDKQNLHLQQSTHISSGPGKLNVNSDQLNIEDTVIGVESSVNDGHLVSRMRITATKENLANIHLPAHSHCKIGDSFAFQDAADVAESEQGSSNYFSMSSTIENPSDKRQSIHAPSEEEILRPVNPGYQTKEVVGSPTCQGITLGMMASSSIPEHLKSRETSRTSAWVCGLDKLNLGERSFISKRETVSTSTLPQRPKYMWNSKSLEGEADSCVNNEITSTSLEKQAGNCTSGQAEQDSNEIEVQRDIPTCCHEHSKHTKESVLSVQLQALGQSMLDHIQILESAVTGRHVVNNDPASDPSAETKGENLANPHRGSKGNVASLVALAELRKISNFLRQL